MTTTRFRWTCSYQGAVDYEVTDATGTYRAEVRWSLPDYALATANGDDVRNEMRTSVGILRRSHCIKLADGSYSFEVPAETVAAFNEWMAAEHARNVAQIKSHPHRYGVVDESDPLLKPRPAVKRGRYVFGEHRWEVLD